MNNTDIERLVVQRLHNLLTHIRLDSLTELLEIFERIGTLVKFEKVQGNVFSHIYIPTFEATVCIVVFFENNLVDDYDCYVVKRH